MSFRVWTWHERERRKYRRIGRQCRYERWMYVYVVFLIIWIANFNTSTINNDGWKYIYNQNIAVTFCLASDIVEEPDNIHPRIIRSKERPSTVTKAITPESHASARPTQKVAPIISRQKTQPTLEKLTLNQIMYRAGKRGLGGGIPGAIAGAFQVLSLMWLRTIINYQSRYGTTFLQALRTLLNEGGVARLYCGVSFALVQAPLARFVSTAANDGVESLLANLSLTRDWGPGRTTIVASIVVGFWRMLLMRTF